MEPQTYKEELQQRNTTGWLKPVLQVLLLWFTIFVFVVAQLDAPSDWRPGGRGFNPRRGRQHSFVEIDHEIFSTVILSLSLIQEGQLSVSGERMCTILVNGLEDKACPVNVWLGKLTALDMTPLGGLGRKTSTQTNNFVFVCLCMYALVKFLFLDSRLANFLGERNCPFVFLLVVF